MIAGYVHRTLCKIGELPNFTIAHIVKVFKTTEGENNVIQVSLCLGDGSFGIPLNKMLVLYHERTLTKQLLLEFIISENYELNPLHHLQNSTKIDQMIKDNVKVALEPFLKRFGLSNVYEFAAHTLNSASAQIINLVPKTGSVCGVTPIAKSTSGVCTLVPLLQTESEQTECHKVLLHWTRSEL